MPVVRGDAIYRDYGWFLLVDPQAPTDPSDYDRLVRLAAAISASQDGPRAGQWVATSKGWLGKLNAGTDRDSALAWLEVLAAEWADDATIEPRPRSRYPTRRDPRPTLTLAMAYTTGDLTLVPREDRGLTWAVSLEVTREITRHALDWLNQEDATTFYLPSTLPTSWSTHILGLPHPDSLTEAVVEPRTRVQIHSGRVKPVRHRTVEFEREGRVACQDVDKTRSTHDRVCCTNG